MDNIIEFIDVHKVLSKDQIATIEDYYKYDMQRGMYESMTK